MTVSTRERELGEVISVPCGDDWYSLSCRDLEAYKWFLKNKNMGNWLYRAIDDTFVNITNLVSLIRQLEEIYDPRVHIVFRGAENRAKCMRKAIFLGGGSGWLMSRPMVAAHFVKGFRYRDAKGFRPCSCMQDDCMTTRIVMRIFGSFAPWSDDLMTDRLDFVYFQGNPATGKVRFDFPACHPRAFHLLRPLNRLVSAHCDCPHRRSAVAFAFCKQMGQLPDTVYAFRPSCTRSLMFCTAEPGIVNRDVASFLNETAMFVTLKDLANPVRRMPNCMWYSRRNR
jgi:hypothetical protein